MEYCERAPTENRFEVFIQCVGKLYKSSQLIKVGNDLDALNEIRESAFKINSVIPHKVGTLPKIVRTLIRIGKKIEKELQGTGQLEDNARATLSTDLMDLKEILVDIYVQFQNGKPIYGPVVGDRMDRLDKQIKGQASST